MDRWPIYSEKQQEFRRKLYQENSSCVFKSEIADLIDNVIKLNEFVVKMEPTIEKIEHQYEDNKVLMDFVRAEIKVKQKRADMLDKITERLVGWGVVVFVSSIGYWIWTHIKQELGIDDTDFKQ